MIIQQNTLPYQHSMIYEIRRGAEIIWSGKAEGKQSRVIMQADMVEVTIKSPVAIAFQKGDTIQVYGETYKLNRPENIAKQNTQIGYTYTVEFEALYYDLGKWILYTLDGSNKLTQPDVYLQGEARTILGLLVQNANRASSGWSLGIVDDTDVIQWTYNSAKLLTVLQDVADQTNLEFWVDGKTINLTRRQNDTGLSLAYGKGKGLYELARSRREDPIVTHLTVAGGSQNIPNSYGHRNIQPTGGNPLVNPTYQDGQDRVESVIVFENIYPRLNAKVTATSAINIIRSTDLDFDLNDHLLDDGTSAQIAFTSGLLNGFTFTIAKDGYTHANKQILFSAITDDNAYPQGIPNEQLKPAIGDTFVLLNIDMPQSYVDHAEGRVKELGDQYFAEEGVEQYDWTGKLTPKFVLENKVELTLGGLVELQAEDIGFNGSIRVDSYTRDLQQEYLYDFTLSNIITINKLIRERNMSDRLANTVSKGISQDGLSTKATFAERAGYSATAGHANTATTAATALRADHATTADNATRAQKADVADYAIDSDKWNGRQFADYLNQPVRTTDTITLSGAIITSQLRIPQISNSASDALWKSGSYLYMGGAKAWAGTADLWNGLEQPTYIDQAVKTDSEVRFNSVASTSYTSGATGHGFRINADGSAEFDSLSIRKELNVVTLNIREILGTGGSFAVTNVAEIAQVYEMDDHYACHINTDGGFIFVPFRANDIVRCQVWDGRGVKYYVARVIGVSESVFDLDKASFVGAGRPASGDKLFQFGNTANAARQGLIYMSNSDVGSPYIDILDGANSANLEGKTKVRLGKLDGITDAQLGALSGYGLFAQNAYLKGKFIVENGSNVYTKSQSDNTVAQAKSDAIGQASGDATNKANSARDAAINAANKFADDALKALSIGGKNYVLDSGRLKEISNDTSGENYITYGISKQLEINTEYTLSCMILMTSNVISADMYYISQAGYHGMRVVETTHGIWAYKTLTFTTGSETSGSDFIRFDNNGSIGGIATLSIRDVKLEKGSKATDWTPAPEDVVDALEVVKKDTNTKFEVLVSEINSKVSESSFNALDQRVGSAETSISQQAGLIEQRATKTEFEALNNNVNGLSGRVNQAETAITQNANQIELRATKTEVTNEIKGISVGARNLYPDGEFKLGKTLPADFYGCVAFIDPRDTDFNVDKFSPLLRIEKNTNGWLPVTDSYTYLTSVVKSLIIGDEYTLSFYYKTAGSINGGSSYIFDPISQVHTPIPMEMVGDKVWRNAAYTFKPNGEEIKLRLGFTSISGQGAWMNVTQVKVEKGNKATDWTPAPEDVSSAIAAVRTESIAAISILDNEIKQKVSTTNFNELGQRVGLTESGIVNLSNSLILQSQSIDSVTGRIQGAEAKLTPTAINLTVGGQIDSKVRAINIGGRNYFRNGDFANPDFTTISGQNAILNWVYGSNPLGLGSFKGHNTFAFDSNGGDAYLYLAPWTTSLQRDTEHTLSFWYRTQGVEATFGSSSYLMNELGDHFVNIPLEGHEDWAKKIFTFKTPPNSSDLQLRLGFDAPSYRWFQVAFIKLETGNKSSDWTPAAEDVDAEIAKRPTNQQIESEFRMDGQGIKMFGKTIDLSGRISFYSLDQGAQDHIQGGINVANAANSVAHTANGKADTANSRADSLQNGLDYVNGKTDAANGRINKWTTPNTTTINGGEITTNSITADKIKVDELTVNRLRTSTEANRTTLNETGDGLLKVRHENGQVGIEMGLINGQPSMIFYDSNGAKLWEAGMAGIVYVNNVPASSAPVNLYLLTSSSTISNSDARNILQSSSNSQNGQPKTPFGTVRYLYNAGNNPDSSQNKQYEGYHTGSGATSAWIPNGWYCVGNQFMARDINAGNNYYNVRIMRIWSGKVTDNVTINDIYILGNV